MDFKFINEIALISVESFIFLLLFVSLTGKRDFLQTHKLKCFIFIIFYVIFTYWLSDNLPVGLHSVALTLLITVLLSFIMQSSVFNSAIIVVITALVITSTDMVVSSIYVAALRMELNDVLNHPIYYPIFAWSSKILQITIALLLYKYGSDRIRINISKSNNSQYMFAALQLLLMAYFIISVNFSQEKVGNEWIYNIMIVALYILSLALSIFDIKEREEMLKVVSRKKILDEYVRNLEDVISVIRREKHDFMNHMQTVYAICKLKKPNALESIDKYIKRLSSDLSISYKFFETGNDYVDGLLAIKSHTCFERDIDLTVNTRAMFSSAAADESDIAGILGNILNNAIECFQPLPENYEKAIQIVTYIEQDRFFLKIINNGPEIPRQIISSVFDKGVTSKADSEEHGLGLYIVKQMALKNKGSIEVESGSGKTEFIVSFNVRGNLNADSGECVIIQDQGA